METIQWKVEGMTCANCALTINKYLQKEGLKNIKVNPIDGDVHFELIEEGSTEKLKEGIESLGYHVVSESEAAGLVKRPFLSNHLNRFLFTLPFTATLMALHLLHRIDQAVFDGGALRQRDEMDDDFGVRRRGEQRAALDEFFA
jgi:Cu+-exporting ATPase